MFAVLSMVVIISVAMSIVMVRIRVLNIVMIYTMMMNIVVWSIPIVESSSIVTFITISFVLEHCRIARCGIGYWRRVKCGL